MAKSAKASDTATAMSKEALYAQLTTTTTSVKDTRMERCAAQTGVPLAALAQFSTKELEAIYTAHGIKSDEKVEKPKTQAQLLAEQADKLLAPFSHKGDNGYMQFVKGIGLDVSWTVTGRQCKVHALRRGTAKPIVVALLTQGSTLTLLAAPNGKEAESDE